MAQPRPEPNILAFPASAAGIPPQVSSEASAAPLGVLTAGPYVARLMLSDFRCYERAALEPDPRPVVLTGPNGAGKTNLLEAISFLAPGRGLRQARLARDRPARPGAERGERRRPWAVAAKLGGPAGRMRDRHRPRPAAAEEGSRDRRLLRDRRHLLRGLRRRWPSGWRCSG